MDEEKNLGIFISERRKKMRLTQGELATKIGVSKSAIAKWETDRGLPDRDNLKRLSDEIHVSVDKLYRIIERIDVEDEDYDRKITPEIIEILESYGYKVISPDCCE